MLIREFEKGPYELVEILRFEKGRRYIYRLLAKDREYFVHIVVLGNVMYVELWHPGYAIPLLIFRISRVEELTRVFTLLKSLTGG